MPASSCSSGLPLTSLSDHSRSMQSEELSTNSDQLLFIAKQEHSRQKNKASHVEEVLQAPRCNAGINERRDAVWQLPDRVAKEVEQGQCRERYRRAQLVPLQRLDVLLCTI